MYLVNYARQSSATVATGKTKLNRYNYLHHMNAQAENQRIGQPVRRKEDLRLITGKGHFSDDVNWPNQAYAYFLRSPHAHAGIRAIDTRAAQRGSDRWLEARAACHGFRQPA
jgi:hypothetical protein